LQPIINNKIVIGRKEEILELQQIIESNNRNLLLFLAEDVLVKHS
jgi:hypothetical protein